jgi:hypothetical protein
MKRASVVNTSNGQPLGGRARPRCDEGGMVWSFVYIFFTNGIPFDAPNRSEPCPFL